MLGWLTLPGLVTSQESQAFHKENTAVLANGIPLVPSRWLTLREAKDRRRKEPPLTFHALLQHCQVVRDFSFQFVDFKCSRNKRGKIQNITH